MSQSKRPTRRDFLKTAGAAVAGVPYIITSSALGNSERPAASDRIVMARDRHRQHGPRRPGGFLNRKDVQYVAMCDVREEVRDRSKATIDEHYENRDCKTYNDFRELLARPDIDAVHIATPDHWHAIITIEACRNGKDVYCQKPETLTLREGPLMIAAARRYGRVVSGGSQRVLGDYRKYVDPAWAGELGKIKSINVNVNPLPQLCNLPAEEMAEKIDWDMWLGPAPWGPYNSKRCSGSFFDQWIELAVVQRLFGRRHDRLGRPSLRRRDVHLRRARAAAGRSHVSRRQGGPVSELPLSQRFHPVPQPPQDARTCPSKGRPAKSCRPSRCRRTAAEATIDGDFIHCVKTREKPFRDIELAVNTAVVSHLGNIAYQLKRSLKWDAARQEFPGDAEANRLIDRARREPWQL